MRKNIIKFSTAMGILFASGDALCMENSRPSGPTGPVVAKIQEKIHQIKANATDLEDLIAPMSAGIARTKASTENQAQGIRTQATTTFGDRLYERIQGQNQGKRKVGLPNIDKGIGTNGTEKGPDSAADRPQLEPAIASYQGGIGRGPMRTLNNRQSNNASHDDQGKLREKDEAKEKRDKYLKDLREGKLTRRVGELEQGIRTNPDGNASKGNSLVPGGTLRDTGKTYYEATVKKI